MAHRSAGRPRAALPALLTTAVTAVLLAVAIGFRLYALGRLPGINGDEAWYGVQAQRLLAGLGVARTPSGNLPGPLHLGLLAALLELFRPSPALLRVPSLLCSFAAMALAWEIGRRHFDHATATAALLLTAALPVNIVYARFGWDPSGDGIVALLAAAAALAGLPLASALAYLLALAVHPANVFLAPFLVLVLLGGDLERRGWRRAAGRSAVHVALLCAALALLAVTTSGGRMIPEPARALTRLTNPGEWREFALRFLRFLSGDAVYGDIVGAGFGRAQAAADALVAALLTGLLAVGAAARGGPGRWRRRGVVAGWIASVVALLLFAGHDAVTPQLLRYAYALAAPTVLALAVLAGDLAEGGAHPLRPRLLAQGVAAAMLASFAWCYLVPLATTGRADHPTFRTGAVEPKQAALARILADAHGRPVEIVAPSWWTYWALAYLAHGTPAAVFGREPPRDADRYWVVYAGYETDRRLAAAPGAELRGRIAGGGKPDLIRIWWVPR